MKQEKISPRIFPMNSKTVSAYFTRACKLLMIDDLRFHDLRHDGVSRLFERGLSIVEVQHVSLHSNWETLKRYCNTDAGDLDI
jgi:integrase